ncbi:MAG: acyltransferase [Duncaniella sp.]|nr:acyltransferase [Duncaniella sp.]
MEKKTAGGLMSREAVSALKGVSIICIVLHNVVHLLSEVKECEFSFSEAPVQTFMESFLRIPVESVISFYGWVVVSVFMFASGYGLTVKYGDRPIMATRWIWEHYKKLFLLLLPVMTGMIVGRLILYGLSDGERLTNMLLQQSLLLNIINPKAISPGVYWYLGLAFQFYLCFLLFRKIPVKGLVAIAVLSWGLTAFLPHDGVNYVRHNCMGWMPEFVLGIILARKEIKIERAGKAMLLISGLVLTVACSVSGYTFSLSGIGFIAVLLSIKDYLTRSRALLFIGSISATLYVVHPMVRSVYLFWMTAQLEANPVLSGIIVLVMSVPVAILYKRLWMSKVG